MSQHTQQYPQAGTELQSLPIRDDDSSLGQVDTLKIVACPICRAIYVPSTELRSCDRATLLETAFLDICHFCFRCQRPACPQCWNPVHHTCASCSEEAKLPFRSPVPSLEGLVFLPLTTSSASTTCTISFTCQRNGRFCTVKPSSARTHTPESLLSVTPEPVTSDALLLLPSAPNAPAPIAAHTSHYPSWLQEAFNQNTSEQTLSPAPERQEKPVDESVISAYSSRLNQIGRADRFSADMVSEQPTRPPMPSALALQSLPAPEIEEHQETLLHDEERDDEDISLAERVENILIVITSILLLAVVLMIVLSICFAQVNTFFLGLLHIDIRTEIAYLLQLR